MGGNLSQSRGWCGLRALRWVAYPSRICWSRGVRFFASSRPTLPFTSTLVLRMRCSRVRRFLSEYPTFDFQLSTFNLPARGAFLVPIPARNPFKHLHLQLSLDRSRNHVVICSLRLSHQPGRTAPQAAPLRNLCVRRLPRLPRPCRGLGRGVPPPSLLTFNFELLTSSSSIFQPLDFSSLGLTVNFQLSTFNRVFFLSPSSPHLRALCGENSSSFPSSLTPRHSPLTTNSFTIRTSETPLPQLLYNPHLQAPLGSAGNKGLITPLESALTKNSPVSRLESALAEKWGGGRPHGVALPSQLSTFNCQLSAGDSDPSEPSTRYIVMPLRSLG